MSRQEMSPGDLQPQQPSLYNQDGSLNAENLATRFGLLPDDAMQEVQFGKYSGTVGEMLNDPRCPVGGQIEKAFAEGGIDGVVDKFAELKQFAQGFFDTPFEVQISQSTIEAHKKKPQGAQIFPPTQPKNL